jgi:D-amino peptidase
VKVFLSNDLEGVAGIVDWSQCRPPGAAYEMGCQLALAEVNAAIEGAAAAGATEFLVNDSHGAMANLAPGALAGEASYLSGRHKPLYMTQGLDETCDVAFFVGYHGSMGSNGILSHTYNPKAVAGVRLNGLVTGEAGINALVALANGVPVALVTGDQVAVAEARPFLPDAEGVAVKQSVTRFAAENLHPVRACATIRDAAGRAVARAAGGEIGQPAVDLPARLEVDWLTADMAEMASWVGGVDRCATRTVAIESDDPLEVYRRFVACVALTRAIVES